jgi:hypothetical protein
VLETAAKLAAWRTNLSDQIHALRSARGARPWQGAVLRGPGGLPPGLQPVDLLRALLADQTEAIASIVPAPNGLLRETANHWKQIATQASAGTVPALDFDWARRFALADVRHGEPHVDVPYLIASLGHDTLKLLLPLSKLVDEDLASGREVLRRCTENARRGTQDRLFEPLLPAYLDRHGGVEAIDRAVQQHHGVLIVGQEETGRTALLEAWLRRLRFLGKPEISAGLHVYQNPFDEPWVKDEAQIQKIAESASLLALTPKGRPAFYDSREEDPLAPDDVCADRLWSYEPEYPDGALETRLIARCAQWASEPWKQVFVIIVVTPAERERLVSRVPLIAEFPAVEVPPIATQDHLPIWLCHTMDRPELGLDQALAVMSELRPADVLAMAPWDVRPVLGSGLAQRLWDPSKLVALEPAPWLQRALLRIQQGRDPWQRDMLGAKGRFVERFIGDDERFASLVQLQALLRGEEGGIARDDLPSFESDDETPASTHPRVSTRVPPRSKDLPADVHFVFRRHHEGPLGKRVRRIRGRSVLEWFQAAWQEAVEAEDPDTWVGEAFGGPVPGLSALFQDVADEGLEPPDTWEELEEILQDHLYVSGDLDDIRLSAHTLRVRTAEDDVETAYYMFDAAYAKAHPDRCTYLLHDGWPLPTNATGGGGFDPKCQPSPLLPAGKGSGATYVCLLESLAAAGLSDLQPRVFPGVRLPELCDHLRRVVPQSERRRSQGTFGWTETWPLELRLLRAMVEDGDTDLGPALERCKRYPLTHVAGRVQHTVGTGPHDQAREAFQEAAAEARQFKRDVDRTQIVVADHVAQMSLWTNETFGYQPWIVFDDCWAAAHKDLARSLLRCASGWDPLS